MKLPYINFPKPTKQQWIEKIQKELKLPEPKLDPLIKYLEQDLFIEPIYTHQDAEKIPPTKIPNRKTQKILYYPTEKYAKIHNKISELAEINDFIIDKRLQKTDSLKIIYNNKKLQDPFTTKIFLQKATNEQKNDIFFADYYAEAGLTSAQQLAIVIHIIETYSPEIILWTTNDYFLLSIAKLFAFHKYDKPVKIWLRNELNTYTRRLPHTNLVRGAIAMFAAAVVKPDAIFCLPFNVHLDSTSEENFNAIRWAINTIHILDYESKIFQTENPLQNTYAIEILAEKIYRKSRQYLAELSEGNPEQIIVNWINEAQQKLNSLAKPKIGANKFTVENEEIPETFAKFYSNKYSLSPYGILAEKINL